MATDLSKEIITGLTITPSSPTSGDKVTVDMTFGESDQESIIKSGDTISMTWPSSGKVYLQAINQSLPVIDPDLNGGTQIGTAQISDGKAMITFNDAVNNQYGVSGYFRFKATAENITSGDAANTTTISVDAGSKQVPVSITKPKTSSAKGPFSTGCVFYKAVLQPTIDSTTNMQTNRWYYQINEWDLDFSQPMVITDEIIAGQEYLPDSLYMTINGIKYSAEEFSSKYPGSSAVYDATTRTLTFIFTPASLNGLSDFVNYDTLGTDTTLQSYKNQAKVSYYPIGYPSGENVALNQESENMIASTEARSVKSGTCQVKKTLQNLSGDPTSTPLEGVSFMLTSKDNTSFTPITKITDAQGVCEFPNLPSGTYTITEVGAPTWLIPNPNPATFTIDDASKNGVVCIITNTIKTTSIKVNKVWVDGGNQGSNRPTSLDVTLYADGKSYATPVTLNETNSWSYTWLNIPQYTATGEIISYSVSEEIIEGYEQPKQPVDAIDGTVTLTNIEQTNITVNKVWDDNGNQDGIRPTTITLTLNADGVPVDVVLPEKNPVQVVGPNWTTTWKNLPVYKDGKQVTYTVTEDTITGYTTAVSEVVSGVITVTNTHKPETTSITANKVWDDNENQDGIRPTTITLTLNADGVPVDVVLPEKNPVQVVGPNWTTTWKNLPVYKDGKQVTYTVTEGAITGYTTAVSGVASGVITVTNTHRPETTSITANKVWDDNGNQDGIRPTTITLTLNADGVPVDVLPPEKNPVQVVGPDWTTTWKNLPVYKNGKQVTYTVTEDTITGYTTAVSGVVSGVITVTNTHRPE
ncbi:Cna B-type domain-containing protein, partial [Niameybacter massiliensis]